MIMFPKRRAPAPGAAAKTSPSIRGGNFRSSEQCSPEEEKKEECPHSASENFSRPPNKNVEQQPSIHTHHATAADLAMAAVNTTTISSRPVSAGPVDLDDTILDDSFLVEEDDQGGVVDMLKESMQDLLGLNTSLEDDNNKGDSSVADGEGGHGCLLFEDDDDDDQSPRRDQHHLAAAGLMLMLDKEEEEEPPSGPLLPPVLRVTNTCKVDLLDDNGSVQRSLPGAGPPSEINIDFDAVPPSPMRDPSVAFLNETTPTLMLGNNTNHSPPAEVEVDLGMADLGVRTKLCDAERLVRVILGRTAPAAPAHPTDSSFSRYPGLEQGSILQAIRSFAIMKQELIELRRQQEQSDGDPPAILTNLTSPATTRNSSSFSTTPAKSSSNSPLAEGRQQEQQPSSPTDDSDSRSAAAHQRQLRATRNALVMAAKKCQSLEEQLKQANEKIDRLELEQQQQQVPSTTSSATTRLLEERLNALEAENRILKSASSRTTQEGGGGSGGRLLLLDGAPQQPKSLVEWEDILVKLHGIPASSVSQDERHKIRQYVQSMVQQTTTHESSQLLREQLATSQQREAETRQQLQAAHDRIQALRQQARMAEEEEDGVPNPLQDAQRLLDEKDKRIAQLEASKLRLQSLVQVAVRKSQPLQESRAGLSAKERLRQLEAERQALAQSVRVLEGHVIQL